MGKSASNEKNAPDINAAAPISDLSTEKPTAQKITIDALHEAFTQFKSKLDDSSENKIPATEEFDFPSYLLQDYQIKKLLEQYKDSYQEFEAVIQNCDKKWELQHTHEGYLDHLTETLSDAIDQLEGLVETLTQTQDQIQERMSIIAPETDDEDKLNDHLSTAQHLVKAQIKSQLFNIAEIIPIEQSSSDNRFFQKELKNLFVALKKLITTKPLNLNKAAAEIIINRLHNHIGFRTDLKSLISPKKLELDEVSSLLTPLFEVTNQSIFDKLPKGLPQRKKKSVNQTLKEQIAATYDALSQLELLEFEPPCTYYKLKNIEDSLEMRIKGLEENLTDSMDEWINKLNNEIGLFDADYDNKYDIRPSIDASHQLIDFIQLQQEQLASTSKEEQEDLANDASAQQRLEYLENDIKALKQVHKDFSVIDTEITSKKPVLVQSYQKLHNKYIQERAVLKKELTQKLSHTQKALAVIHSSTHKKNLSEIEAEANWIEQESENKPLSEFKEVYEEQLFKLDAFLDEVKSKLSEDYTPQYRTILEDRFDFNLDQFNKNNPFLNHLTELNKQVIQDTRTIKAHLKDIIKQTDAELADWPEKFRALKENAYQSIDKRNDDVKTVKVIDERIQKPAYTITLQIIKALSDEINRIILRHVDAAISKAADSNQLLELKKNATNNADTTNLLMQVNLNSIDPRLKILCDLRKEFLDTNAAYINLDLNKLSDMNYLQQIKGIVESKLHHQNMEIYSDAKRIKLVQWLRKHVIKPVMSFSFQTSSRLHKNSENQYRFFVTPGATITERNIAHTGYEAYQGLKGLSAAAAG